MGLDMSLYGRKFLFRDWQDPDKNLVADGFPVTRVVVDLAYWRKNPNLHGYIVREFADGQDNCQEIRLTECDLQRIMDAVEKGELPPTTGFFFGSGDWWATPERVEETMRLLHGALRWLQDGTPKEREVREVYYQASW